MFKESKLQFVTRAIKAVVGPLAVAACVLASGQTAYADTVINLTTAGSDGTGVAAIGGTFDVVQIPDQSTGTGVIDPFLRIQAVGNEGGYNTDGSVEYDAKSGTWTHAIQLSDLATSIVNIGGVSYYRFMLDINQNTGGGPNDPVPNEYLSLNQIQIFQSAGDLGIPNSQDTLTAATATAPPLISFVGATEVFRMNNATDPNTEILLNYNLNPGSGAGDMFLYVRTSNFANNPNSFITLYSQFGTPPGTAGSNDGFEEWALITGDGDDINVPEPASLLLFGVALTLGGMRMRKSARKA